MDEIFKKKLKEKNAEAEKRRLIAQGLISEEPAEEKKNKRMKQFGQGFKKALDWE